MAIQILPEDDPAGKRRKLSLANQRVKPIKQRSCRPDEQKEAFAEEDAAQPGRPRQPALNERVDSAQSRAVRQVAQKADPGHAAGPSARQPLEYLQIAAGVVAQRDVYLHRAHIGAGCQGASQQAIPNILIAWMIA